MADVPATIERLFASRETITSGEVAAAAGVTRQAAYYHLSAMAHRGLLLHEGKGRGGRYRRASLLSEVHLIDGLEEHVVWGEDQWALKSLKPTVFADNPKVKPILDWAFTEMLNNAIDHSEGIHVMVRWFLEPGRIIFEIEDDGIGVFRKMRQQRGLRVDFESIGEIAKGRQTTAPERHSGLGIFYSSKMVSRFMLSSGQLTWTVDASIDDQAIGGLDQERVGTLVRCEVSMTTRVVPLEVFDAFSDPETYGSKSTLRVSLFREGDAFVSRSEAKRVGAHLEKFDMVELDFSGIQQVGQGFIDELFRIWRKAHPGTRLVPVHANPAIVALIESTLRQDRPDP